MTKPELRCVSWKSTNIFCSYTHNQQKVCGKLQNKIHLSALDIQVKIHFGMLEIHKEIL